MKQLFGIFVIITFALANALPWLHYFDQHHHEEHRCLHADDIQISGPESTNCDLCDLFFTKGHATEKAVAESPIPASPADDPIFNDKVLRPLFSAVLPPRAPPVFL